MPDERARKRLQQTFKFLKELNSLRHPEPQRISEYSDVLRMDTWPRHPSVIVNPVADAEAVEEADNPNAKIEPVISIKKVNKTRCPKPPKELDGWV